MMIYHDKIEKKEINSGVIWQYLGKGNEMMVYHWNMADGSEVACTLMNLNSSAIASKAVSSLSKTVKNMKSARAMRTSFRLMFLTLLLQSEILKRLIFSTRSDKLCRTVILRKEKKNAL